MIIHAIIFTSIRQVGRSDQIIQHLSNAIITGLLELKEQLPNGTGLAGMMDISYITIREALNTLRANSLIHAVRGRNDRSFIYENIGGKNNALCLFKATSTDYLSDLDEAYCAIIGHSARLISQRMTGADIAKFHEFVEVLRKVNSPELITQTNMRCLLAIAAGSHSTRLADRELQVRVEQASLVAMFYRANSIHAKITALHSALADMLTAHNETESVQFAMQIIDTLIYYPIEKKLEYNSN